MTGPATYPPGTVRALLDTDLVTPPTRAALRARLAVPRVEVPRFFTAAEFATLRAVCDRLIPQADRAEPVDIAGGLDARMADGEGDGWRYAILPPDPDLHRAGLAGIDQSAAAMFGGAFYGLSDADRDAVLAAVQAGRAAGAVWAEIDGPRYAEELLTQAADIYYAHPLASEEIGYVGMADAHGWQAIRLGERAAHKPAANGGPS